jgi:hypothetical protein
MKTIIQMARESGLVFNEEHGTDIAKSIHLSRVQAFAELVRADERELVLAAAIDGAEHAARKAAAYEREAIYEQWHSCVMSDLENGVKWLNEKAAADWHKNYPAQSNLFPAWIEARGNT